MTPKNADRKKTSTALAHQMVGAAGHLPRLNNLGLNPVKESFFSHRFQKLVPNERNEVLSNLYAQESVFLTAFPNTRLKKHESRLNFLFDLKPDPKLEAYMHCLRAGSDLAARAELEMFLQVQKYYPGNIVALEHIYSGGVVGLLTARSDKEGGQVVIDTISDFWGYKIFIELAYFVNDPKHDAHLVELGLHSAADKKPEIMFQSSRRFAQVTTVDDSDKNFRAFLKRVLEKTHVKPEKIDELLAKAHASKVTEEKLLRCTVKGASPKNGDHRKVRFIHTKNINFEHRWRSLMRHLNNPVPFNSKNHLLLADVDGTLLELEGNVYVRDREDMEGKPLLTMAQEQMATDPMNENWLRRAAEETGLPVERLVMDYRAMEKAEFLTPAITKGLEGNRMFKPKNVSKTPR